MSHGQAKRSLDTGVERKPSQPYGHHRQTSIVNGVQHSRNPSQLSSVNTSPLSPQKIMESGTPDSAGGPAGTDLMKYPSVSALHGNTSNGSVLPSNRSFESDSPQRRLERMHSGRIKRGREHQRSHSKNPPQSLHELKTVGEYALHHLFTSFVGEADKLIERCLAKAGDLEPQVENVCGPGADPAFDQLISSLAHINRHKPKALIDSVIKWRKDKGNIANALMTELQSLRDSISLPPQTSPNGSFSVSSSPPGGQDILIMEHKARMAERSSVVSIYILCRVLIEAIGQTTLAALHGSDLNTAGLEDVIYGQLQNAEPESFVHSPLRKANWVIRGQLLGVMSGIRFEAVVGRFIKDLEIAQTKLSVKGLADSRLAAKTAVLVQSMRWLKVRSHPEDAWEQSCNMLQLLAKFFAEVHGRMMKHAYAELFEHLLIPIAATATSELNVPKWKDVLTVIQPKITQMLSKADHWPHVFPLQAVLLCVSPADQFATQWFPLVASSQARAKDRAGRSYVLKATCRLVWRYLYRHEESQSAIAKRLDEIVKLVFQGGKRVLISTDPAIADPLIQLIRIIGYKHQDLCFRTIVFPLMNSELFSGPESQLKIESLDPERTVIAIRAFLAIMADLEKNQPPPYPTSFECDALIDPSSRSPITHRRTKSQGFAVSAGRTERLSRPVLTSNFNEVTKEYYVKFCKILGQLTIICDNTFGGQAVLDERIATHTPKTPMAEAFTFNKREDVTNPTDLRQHYYDLLHVAVEALPRCLSPHLPINALINLLCTGTAHVQSHIASSSAQSLKSIAKQSYAQQVTIGFARFIFNFDDRYATVSDSSLLGPGHIESTLKLYVELLEIWIDDIQKRTQPAVTEPINEEHNIRQLPLDLSSILAHVDEVEGHGLFFLCSPSRTVRAIAVNVLRLVTKFDTILGKPLNRIISILEGGVERVLSVNHEQLSVAARSRLQKGSRTGTGDSILVELCSSDVPHDAALWFKLFPNIVRLTAQDCLQAVAFTRELVCQRLAHSYRTINALAEGNKQTSNAAFEFVQSSSREGGRFNSSSADVIIEQWKVHLIFACTTVTYVSSSHAQPPKSSHGPQHSRKSSKSSGTSQEKITSANELFSKVVPFLSVPNQAVQNAAVIGLGATNATLYHTLLQSLQPYVQECNSEAKERVALHQRNVSSPRRIRRTDCLRTEITHLLSLTSHLLKDEPILEDDFAVTYLIDYAKHLRIFLSDTEIQSELEFSRLRMHFCSLIEGLYDCTRELKDSTLRMSFQSRQATFSLMENWCGFSPNERQLRQREDHIRRSILANELDIRKQGVINSAMEKERIELQNAALSAMAALCAGPLTFGADGRILMQFDVRRMLAWVSSIFENPSDRTHAIGRRALQNLIVHNQDQPFLIIQTMRMCYVTQRPKALVSYFEVVIRVLTECSAMMVPFWKILCLALHTLSSEDSQIRMKSARLLRTLEETRTKTSTIHDLEISVSDKTTAVYKLAQFEMSQRLSKQHPELAFHVFSEFSAYFNEIQPDQQRNMVSAMLPWIQTVELQLDPNGGPTGTSYMLLVNLFEITTKSSIAVHNEIQALWKALATGPYGGNVLFVLDFIINICLDKREHNFVVYAKQIVVFLSKTPGGARVLDHLLLQITPKTMISERREPMAAPTDSAGLPYIADLALVLPSGAKQNPLSLGQVCMILLVDLIVSPFTLPVEKIPALLQVVLVQWDQNVIVVREHAREMLVHLVHELVISKIEPDSTQPDKSSIEDFIEAIRGQETRISWSYADTELGSIEEDSCAVSGPLVYVVDKLVKIFSLIVPGIRERWGRISMEWATTCAVRHIACRSFQIFRSISTAIDPKMLVDMLARLANTIADDENTNFPMFSLEILITLRTAISALPGEKLQQNPQLFWTTCACLDTIFESEFQEGLSMLGLLLDKLDLNDRQVLEILIGSQPPAWEGPFQGVHALLCKGVRSRQSMDRSIILMQRLLKLPSSEIIGLDDRLLFTVLANLPRYLHYLEDGSDAASCLESAQTIASIAEAQNHGNLSKALQNFFMSNYRNQKDFLSQCMAAIRTSFFPSHEFQSLVFLLGMVNNQCGWFKVKTMQVLSVMIANVDMRKPEIASQGLDLISPLLRLLQTEHCQQALNVLDNVIDMSETPLDNKHLRMSMVGWRSNRATRKQYESTRSLYGIPEESGWSVPMPAIHSMQTRHNVAAILSTINLDSLDDLEGGTTPEVEFQTDEYQDSYFGSRSDTLVSDDTKVDGNMGELAMKLDSLDDFFDEPGDAVSPMELSREPYPSGLIEEREHLYDQQALPILRRSLRRNPSVTSFQTGFNEYSFPPPREPNVMNPLAFAHIGSIPARPGLHNRSATSPIMTTRKALPLLQNDTITADDTGDETEAFSDDELSLERAHTMDDTHQMQNTVKPAGFKAGFRQGLRRLTNSGGSKAEVREVLKTSILAKSPKVPKIPNSFLNPPMSAEP